MKTSSLAHVKPVSPPALLSGKFFSRSGDRKSVRLGTTLARTYTCFSAVFILLLLLSACSEDSKPAQPAKPEVKGPELITRPFCLPEALRRGPRLEPGRQALPSRSLR